MIKVALIVAILAAKYFWWKLAKKSYIKKDRLSQLSLFTIIAIFTLLTILLSVLWPLLPSYNHKLLFVAGAYWSCYLMVRTVLY
ncbi:MAG: hypothetical protein HYV52_03160 [Parcubacteria group bacterium]|nr:hypothetical protein [Parcubacteria group bacterium]